MIRKETIPWQISNSMNVAKRIFPVALTISQITFQICYLQKVGQCYEYYFLNEAIRWQMLKSTKVVSCIFVLALTVSGISTVESFDIEKGGQDHGLRFSKCGQSRTFDGKRQILQTLFLTFQIFAKIQPEVTIVKHTHTQKLKRPWQYDKSHICLKHTFEVIRPPTTQPPNCTPTHSTTHPLTHPLDHQPAHPLTD